jgi:hypothetical protein
VKYHKAPPTYDSKDWRFNLLVYCIAFCTSGAVTTAGVSAIAFGHWAKAGALHLFIAAIVGVAAGIVFSVCLVVYEARFSAHQPSASEVTKTVDVIPVRNETWDEVSEQLESLWRHLKRDQQEELELL